MEQFALTHAWLIPLAPALAFVIIGLFLQNLHKLATVVSIGCSAFSFVLSTAIATAVLSRGISVETPLIQRADWISILGLKIQMGVIIDPLSAMMLFVVTTISLLIQIYSIGYMHGNRSYGRFFAYMSLFAASMLGLNISSNFLQMYVFWEGVGLCSYLLIGFDYHRIAAREAAKKAFITTRVGDFGLLLGILLLQTTIGTVDFLGLKEILPNYIASYGTGMLTIIGVLIFIGPLGKSAQFPLHVWLPDAMEGPAPVSALIHAATMVVAGVYLIARAYFIFVNLPGMLHLIAWIGCFTAFFGACIAFSQHEIKKILAYSTISQLGYMMLALGVGSITASLFHLMTHAFFKAMLFLCAGAVMHAMSEEADIFKMGGLRKKIPVVFVCMAIGVLAISGIPPFAGFFSKDEIIAATAQVSMPLYTLAMLTACMTAFYMARLLFTVFFGEPADPNQEVLHVSKFMQAPLIVLAVFSVISGLVGYLGDFSYWVRYGEAEPMTMNVALALSSTMLSLAAFIFAWAIYGSKKISSDAIAHKLGFLYNLSFHKFYVDEFYALLIRYFIDGIGKIMYFIDVYIVDGTVNGVSRCVILFSGFLSKFQTGQVQRYAAIFFGGVIILLVCGIYYFDKVSGLLAQGGAL